jgi:hypothetical protein
MDVGFKQCVGTMCIQDVALTTRLDTCRNDDASGAVIVLGLVWPRHGKGWPLSQVSRHILAKFPHY